MIKLDALPGCIIGDHNLNSIRYAYWAVLLADKKETTGISTEAKTKYQLEEVRNALLLTKETTNMKIVNCKIPNQTSATI